MLPSIITATATLLLLLSALCRLRRRPLRTLQCDHAGKDATIAREKLFVA